MGGPEAPRPYADIPKSREVSADDRQIRRVDTGTDTIDEDAEVQSPNEIAFIGASLMWGLDWQTEGEPARIATPGNTSTQILANLRNNKNQLRGKKVAVIHAGGNDAASGIPIETILKNIQEMIKICREEGVPKIVVLTRPPYGRDLQGREQMKAIVRDLGDEIVNVFGLDEHDEYLDVQTVDMYHELVTRDGSLPVEYTYKDNIHPNYEGYCRMLEILADQVPELGRLAGDQSSPGWIRHAVSVKRP